MATATSYLLDTGILLHWVRGGVVAQRIDQQFSLRQARFRPLICEVSLGEMEAFARGWNWSERKRQALAALKKELVTVDISDPRVLSAYGDFSTLAKVKGWPIFNDKNDLWIAAAVRVTGTTLMTMDRKAFVPLRDSGELAVTLLDPRTGELVA